MSKAWNNASPSLITYPLPEAMNDAMAFFILLKITGGDNTWMSFMEGRVGTDVRAAFGRRPGSPGAIGQLYYSNTQGIVGDDDAVVSAADGWCRVFQRRTAAAATETYKCPIGGSLSTAVQDALADGLSAAGGVMNIGGPSDPASFLAAAYAWWNGTPPSAAAMAAVLSTQDILDLSPSHCYDENDEFTNDLVGTNDRTSAVAITDSGDDPAGWVYIGGAPPAAPINTVAPAVTGNKWRGQTLSCTTGTWTGDPTITYAYQWQRDDSGGGLFTNIGGATNATKAIVSADVGCQLRCRVTASNPNGDTTAGSNLVTAGQLYKVAANGDGGAQLLICGSGGAVFTGSVAPGPDAPVCTVSPHASGVPVVGQTVVSTQGTWTGAVSFAYQWQRSANGQTGWTNIAGANSLSYVVAGADVDKYLRCAVTASG